MNIVLTFNYHNKDKYGIVSEEFDTPETIDNIKKAVEQLGHTVFLIEADENFYGALKRLKDQGKVDFVFNYAVGIYGRSREAHIPAICEMLQIPYSASDVLSTALCEDKGRSKEILEYHNIPTPAFQIFRSPDEQFTQSLDFPLIIKYAYQGTSIGLEDEKAVVRDVEEMKGRIHFLYNLFPQNVIVEEYISGREFTVGFYGNHDDLVLFPLVEIHPSSNQKKENWIFNSRQQPVTSDVIIDSQAKDLIYDLVKKIIDVFELRDWGRVDLRFDEHLNQPYILEINNCAHLSLTSVYYEGAKAYGLSHSQLIQNMLNSALRRYDML